MSYNPRRYDDGILYPAVKMALGLQDEIWYGHMLRTDILSCALTRCEEQAVVNGAVQTAANMARQVNQQYGFLSVQQLLKTMRLKLSYTSEELRDPYLYLGLYEPVTRTVTLNNSTVALVQQFIRINGLDALTPAEDIITVALFHEIFHALEEETPDIYTRSRMLNRKMLGIFKYKRSLSGASEVGAVHFSKCMAGVSYSPCIYERYLLLALGLISIDFLLPTV